MIVCHCAVVSDRDVVAAAAQTGCSLAAVCRATGAGQSCGGCVPTVRDLLCRSGARDACPCHGLARREEQTPTRSVKEPLRASR